MRRWAWSERLMYGAAGRLTTWPAKEFDRFLRASLPGQDAVERIPAVMPPGVDPEPAPGPSAVAPETFELRFSELQRQARYDEMWDLLAEDAQRAWGGRAVFAAAMRRQAEDGVLLGATVSSVEIIPEWADRRRRRRSHRYR